MARPLPSAYWSTPRRWRPLSARTSRCCKSRSPSRWSWPRRAPPRRRRGRSRQPWIPAGHRGGKRQRRGVPHRRGESTAQSEFYGQRRAPHRPRRERDRRTVQALGASLILMTTHGRSGLGRALFGSTADAVRSRLLPRPTGADPPRGRGIYEVLSASMRRSMSASAA